MKGIYRLLVCAFMAVSLVGCSSETGGAAAAGKFTPGTYTGTADGYGGPVTVEITVDENNVTDVKITGDKETPAVGGAALEELTKQVKDKGTAEIDGVSGATYTTTAVKEAALQALNQAMGITATAAASTAAAAEAVTASSVKEGVGIVSTPRLGPGKDEKETPVYSFNETVAYVITDGDGKILDLEVDVLEVITPNHDASNEEDNFLAGWPGQTYSSDDDGDGKINGDLAETEDIFTSELGTWTTKRQKGDAYKLNSGTWTQEMDIFENFFKGKTVAEIKDWYTKYCSDVNGRPLTDKSDKDEDVAKYGKLTDDEKKTNDLVSGATMSVHDAHGDIIGAIEKAVNNSKPVETSAAIKKLGLGIKVTPRLGPGKDDKDVPVYSFNTVVDGMAFDADGKIVSVNTDVLEVITPNHDGADDNSFTGWPGQSYNADTNADGKVEEVYTQTEDTFQAQVSKFTSKRDLGDKYKLNSGTWTEEMSAYEGAMLGKTTAEVDEWFKTYFSDVNGRALHGTSDKDEDKTKYAALTDDQKKEIDSISSATMSLSDAHGDIIGTIDQAYANAKDTDITVK